MKFRYMSPILLSEPPGRYFVELQHALRMEGTVLKKCIVFHKRKVALYTRCKCETGTKQ